MTGLAIFLNGCAMVCLVLLSLYFSCGSIWGLARVPLLFRIVQYRLKSHVTAVLQDQKSYCQIISSAKLKPQFMKLAVPIPSLSVYTCIDMYIHVIN